jgi:hypothetical protein
MNSVYVIILSLLFLQACFLFMNALSQRRIREVSESTHVIVNSQRTMMLRAIALLSRRVADDNPGDEKAQDAARTAETDAERSGTVMRVKI